MGVVQCVLLRQHDCQIVAQLLQRDQQATGLIQSLDAHALPVMALHQCLGDPSGAFQRMEHGAGVDVLQHQRTADRDEQHGAGEQLQPQRLARSRGVTGPHPGQHQRPRRQRQRKQAAKRQSCADGHVPEIAFHGGDPSKVTKCV
jgi:hypothetical protein